MLLGVKWKPLWLTEPGLRIATLRLGISEHDRSSFALNLCYKNYRYHKCFFKLHPLLASRICFPTPIPFSFLISPTRYKVCTIQIIFNKILLFVAEAWIHTSPPLLDADWVVSFWSIHYWTLVLISHVSRDNCFSANMFNTLTIWTEGDVPCRPPGFPHISVLLPVLKETGWRMIDLEFII